MKEDDKYSQEEIIKRICCSVGTFFMSNCCWGFLTIAMLAIGLLGLFLTGTAMAIYPVELYLTTIAFAGYTILIMWMGCIGVCLRVELCFILYIFFAAIGLLGQICGFSFLVLYTLDIAGYQDASTPIISGTSFIQNYYNDVAIDEQDVWLDFQDSLDCCGVTFERGFSLFQIDDDASNAQLELLESGSRCVEEANSLLLFRNGIENDLDFDEVGNLEAAKDDDLFGIDGGFFCVSAVSEILAEQIPTVAVAVGLIVLVQLCALVSGARMYWVPEFLGGWALDEEAMTDIAEHKGIKFAAPAGGYSGGRVLSTIRNAGARVSYRVQNAVTPDPRVEPGAGFLKRLSTNRAVSFVGAAPSNTRPEEDEAVNAGGRVSSVRSMLSVISKGFGRAPKSLIDTSAMGISQSPPGLGGNVPKGAQAAAATARNEEVSTRSKLLASYTEEPTQADSLQI